MVGVRYPKVTRDWSTARKWGVMQEQSQITERVSQAVGCGVNATLPGAGDCMVHGARVEVRCKFGRCLVEVAVSEVWV